MIASEHQNDKTVIGVNKGMLPVKYFHPSKASLCQFNIMDIIRLLANMRLNLAILGFVDITRFKIVVSLNANSVMEKAVDGLNNMRYYTN